LFLCDDGFKSHEGLHTISSFCVMCGKSKHEPYHFMQNNTRHKWQSPWSLIGEYNMIKGYVVWLHSLKNWAQVQYLFLVFHTKGMFTLKTMGPAPLQFLTPNWPKVAWDGRFDYFSKENLCLLPPPKPLLT